MLSPICGRVGEDSWHKSNPTHNSPHLSSGNGIFGVPCSIVCGSGDDVQHLLQQASLLSHRRVHTVQIVEICFYSISSNCLFSSIWDTSECTCTCKFKLILFDLRHLRALLHVCECAFGKCALLKYFCGAGQPWKLNASIFAYSIHFVYTVLEVLAFGQLTSGNTGKSVSPGRLWWTRVGIPKKAFFHLYRVDCLLVVGSGPIIANYIHFP